MRKTLYLPLMLLLLAPSVLGVAPTLISQFDLNDSIDIDPVIAGEQLAFMSGRPVVFDNKIGFGYCINKAPEQDALYYTDLRNLGGGLFYRNKDYDSAGDVFCGSDDNEAVNYEAGLLFSSQSSIGAGIGRETKTRVYDVTDALFISQRADIPGVMYYTVYNNGETVEGVFSGNYYKLNATDGVINYGAVTRVAYNKDQLFFHDRTNRVIWNSGFYRYADYSYDDYNDQTLLGNYEVYAGNLADWNRNPLNPEYMTDEGYLVIVGGANYDTIQTSSLSLDWDDYFYFERGNVVGVRNGTFVYANLTGGNFTTVDTGIVVPGDIIYRSSINTITVYNSTETIDRTVYIYSVPTPDFFTFLEETVNTPPTQDLEFLGVDVANRFIFKNTVTDGQGGRVYQAQAVDFTINDFEDLTVSEVIGYDNEGDLQLVADSGVTNTYGLLTSQPVEHAGTNFGSNSLEWNINQDGAIVLFLRTPFTPEETNFTGTALVWSLDSTAFLSSDERHINLAYVDTQGKYLTEFYIERFKDNNTAYIYERDGLVDTLLGELSLTGEEDYFRFLNNFNFTSKQVEVIITTLNDSLATTRPFIDNTSYGFAGVGFGDDIVGYGDLRLRVDTFGLEYTLNAPRYPDYDLIDIFDAGETQIFATALASQGYGDYLLYSWATDQQLGTTNYDYLTTLRFTYNNNTVILDQNTINQLIADAIDEAGIDESNGFLTPIFIEGDLVTDTLFGYLDEWNIKTTASKFLVGLLLVFLAIAGGASAGGSISSVAGAVGSVFGAVGGLFLVTYWGLFPAWVTLVITLVVFVIVASMARNALTGRGD